MTRLLRLLKYWQWGLALALCTGIAHIGFSMVMPVAFGGNAFSRLANSLPLNSFVILPTAEPKSQVLPYQASDVRYAMCRFDLGSGPVIATARLPDAGWTFSIYTSQGEAVYAFAAQTFTDVAIGIMPPGERFVDLVPVSQKLDTSLTQVAMAVREGMVVVRAPLLGRTYSADIEKALTSAQCRVVPY
jgi:uncharacterized membrane protein